MAGTLLRSAILQAIAPMVPALMIVAKAVAVEPTWTERLVGRTAATRSGTNPGDNARIEGAHGAGGPGIGVGHGHAACLDRGDRRPEPAHLAVTRHELDPCLGDRGEADRRANGDRLRVGQRLSAAHRLNRAGGKLKVASGDVQEPTLPGSQRASLRKTLVLGRTLKRALPSAHALVTCPSTPVLSSAPTASGDLRLDRHRLGPER